VIGIRQGGIGMVSATESTGLRAGVARDFAEQYMPESDATRLARQMAGEIGLTAVSPGTGATLCMLAAAASARAVIEIGTGTGVSGLWLLRGMRPDGVLTTIDYEPEHQRIAKRSFSEGGYPTARARTINGRALDVLPRLADKAYDLLFLDGDRADYQACADAAPRLLRAGGILVVNGALAGGRIADPSARDPQTLALRELVRWFRDSDEWRCALVPIGDTLLCAVRA
jgi:predicted O-methyltransferase YrrM